MSVETFRESTYCEGVKPSVDRHKGIIHGVKLVGLQSRNGRQYTQECLTDATPLYEGAKVNVNHKGGPREYGDRMGVIRGVVQRQDGLYGDYHFNPRHALAEQLIWDAENSPENVGFSHNVDATVSRDKDGATIVEKIHAVRSVDLVADPATTNGLFEGEDIPDGPDREFCVQGLSAVSDARSILLSVDPIEKKQSRLMEVLSRWQHELGGSTNKESATMEWKDITVENLKENRNDLFAVITGTDETSKLQKELGEAKEALKTANDKLAIVESEKCAAAKVAAISEELKAAKLDATNKVVVSEAFMAQLNAAQDAGVRKNLIEDRLALTKALRETPVPGAAPFAPVAGSGDYKAPETTKDFLSRL